MAGSGRRRREWPGAALHPSAGHPPVGPPAGAPRWTVLRVVLVVGFLAALLLVPVIWKRNSSGANPDGTDHASAAPAGAGYRFLQVNRSGTPVRWNPCGTIHYQLDLSSAPSWAETDIGDAISSISMATGIQFAYDGPTDQFPDGQVPAGAGGSEPPPVVIAWANVAQTQQLNLAEPGPAAPPDGGVSVGTAGTAPGVDSLARTYPVMAKDDASGHGVYVTGSVVIGAAASSLSDGFGPGGAGVLLLHQLGRLVGLGDVSDPSEVMSTDVLATRVTGLGRGDLAGLARLGTRSGCLEEPTDPSLYVAS